MNYNRCVPKSEVSCHTVNVWKSSVEGGGGGGAVANCASGNTLRTIHQTSVCCRPSCSTHGGSSRRRGLPGSRRGRCRRRGAAARDTRRRGRRGWPPGRGPRSAAAGRPGCRRSRRRACTPAVASSLRRHGYVRWGREWTATQTAAAPSQGIGGGCPRLPLTQAGLNFHFFIGFKVSHLILM